MQISQEQGKELAHAFIGSIRQFVLDNCDEYILFLESRYGKDSEITQRKLQNLEIGFDANKSKQ